VESDIIGQRTADAMAEAKARGQRFGRERLAPDSVVERIACERQSGATFAAIASGLDADSIPTPGGGVRWYPSTVQRLVRAEQVMRTDRRNTGDSAAASQPGSLPAKEECRKP
jgi:hypothetical protein